MVLISGVIRLGPGDGARAKQIALDMARASEAEAGCRAYRFSVDLEDENVFHLFEMWESADALAAHFETPHMAQFRKQLADLTIVERTLRRYAVTDETEM
jgi:quinol monooxygenase YgiN